MAIETIRRVVPDKKAVLPITVAKGIHGWEVTQPAGRDEVNRIFVHDTHTLRELHEVIGELISTGE